MTTSEAERISTGWVPDAGTFGARLALVRQRMSWGNVKEAATVCGLPAESWRTWERDGVAPRKIVEVAERIASKSGCDYLWLLTGSTSGRVPTRGYVATPTQPTHRSASTIAERHASGVHGKSSTRPHGAGRPPSYSHSARRPALIGH